MKIHPKIYFSFLFQFVLKWLLWLFFNEFQSTVSIPIFFFGFQSIWASNSYFHLLKMILKMRMKACAPNSHKMNKTTEKSQIIWTKSQNVFFSSFKLKLKVNRKTVLSPNCILLYRRFE